MDREKAKFILQSFRPDGADAGDSHFAEALMLAAEDRELGLWLADERAHDAMFAEALQCVDIPEGLKAEILSVLENDQSMPEDAEFDSIFAGALMDVTLPSDLRDQIISAMEVESSESKKVIKFPRSKWLNLSAIAVILMVGAAFMFSQLPENDSENRIALHNVQIEIGKLINANHEFDLAEGSLGEVNEWLVNKGLPDASKVPNGLISKDAQTKGGRKLVLDNGVEASMIFFEKKGTAGYYLMILKTESVKNIESISSMKKMSIRRCFECPVTHFNIISWRDADKVYMLLTKQAKKAVMDLF